MTSSSSRPNLLSSVANNNANLIAAACVGVDNAIVVQALRFAVFKHREMAVVNELLRFVGKDNLTEVLVVAVERNNLKAFDAVYAHCNTSDNHEKAVRAVVMRGDVSRVTQLLESQDITDYGHELLAQAIFNVDTDMVELLFDRCNPQRTLEYLRERGVVAPGTQSVMDRLMERLTERWKDMERERQRCVLIEAIEPHTSHIPQSLPRKM